MTAANDSYPYRAVGTWCVPDTWHGTVGLRRRQRSRIRMEQWRHGELQAP